MNFIFSLEHKKKFWALQLIGWLGFLLLTYFSLTLWYNSGDITYTLIHNVLQAVLGIILSFALGGLFKKLWHKPLTIRLLLSSFSIIIIAMLWNVLRMQLFVSVVLGNEKPLEIHPEWRYDTVSIFFDFSQDISAHNSDLYFWDQISLNSQPNNRPEHENISVQTSFPIAFQNLSTSYQLIDFGGVSSTVIANPIDADGNVVATLKLPNALGWAGTSIKVDKAIPISTQLSKISLQFMSENPNSLVRLKLENSENPLEAIEMEEQVQSNGQWKPVVFDFNQSRTADFGHKTQGVWDDFGGWFFSALLIFLCWSALYHLIKYAEVLQLERDKANDEAKEAQYKEAKAMIEAKEAQLQMLRYQLNPHFLFNTLNTMYALIKMSEVETAKLMVNKLSRFLRYSLEGDPNQLVKLSQEIETLELYLSIEKVRFEERLEFTYQLDEDVNNALVPSLILQPLVENSIKYAVSAREDKGIINLSAKRKGTYLEITLTDNGADDEMSDVNTNKPSSTGIGHKNVQQRLETLFGDEFSFTFEFLKTAGTRATIKIPVRYS